MFTSLTSPHRYCGQLQYAASVDLIVKSSPPDYGTEVIATSRSDF